MSDDTHLIRSQRLRLINAFYFYADHGEHELGTSPFSDDTLDLINRLFFRISIERSFAIDLNSDPTRGHEVLIARTGDDYNNEMMTLFVPKDSKKLKLAWELYVSWMGVKVSAENISALITDFDDGSYGEPEP